LVGTTKVVRKTLDGTTKVVLFFMTVLGTIGTVWFALPAFLDIWKDTTTNSSSYGLGFMLGFAVGLYWAVLLSRWSKS